MGAERRFYRLLTLEDIPELEVGLAVTCCRCRQHPSLLTSNTPQPLAKIKHEQWHFLHFQYCHCVHLTFSIVKYHYCHQSMRLIGFARQQ